MFLGLDFPSWKVERLITILRCLKGKYVSGRRTVGATVMPWRKSQCQKHWPPRSSPHGSPQRKSRPLCPGLSVVTRLDFSWVQNKREHMGILGPSDGQKIPARAKVELRARGRLPESPMTQVLQGVLSLQEIALQKHLPCPLPFVESRFPCVPSATGSQFLLRQPQHSGTAPGRCRREKQD